MAPPPEVVEAVGPVTAVVEDGGPQRIASATFKKEPDGSKFRPSGCELVPST